MALRKLNVTVAPVHVCHNLDDALKLLDAEEAENECRLALDPVESVHVGRKRAELLRPAQRQKQKTGKSADGRAGGRGKKKPSSNLDEGFFEDENKRRTNSHAAKAAGMGRTSFEKADAVVKAAEFEPEKYGSLVEEMKRTRKVNGAYKKLKTMQAAEAIAPANHSLRVISNLWLQQGPARRGHRLCCPSPRISPRPLRDRHANDLAPSWSKIDAPRRA